MPSIFKLISAIICWSKLLDIYCPVLENGKFDDSAPDWLTGVSVWDGNGKVVEHLRASGHLFHDEMFSHSYPHDWRSKTNLFYRYRSYPFINQL